MAYKTELVQFKVRPEDKKILQEKAEKENMTLAEYIRFKLLRK